MGRASTITDDAAAVRELKETIRNQAAEIKALKSKVSPRKQSSGGAHGGGGGEEVDVSSYLSRPFYSIASQRVGWLSLFLVSLSLTALIISGFEHTLSRQIELAYFVPLLAGHGGNTGGQTVGTVLSAIGAGAVQLRDAPRVIAKEAASGLTVGIILGCLVGLAAHYALGIQWPVAIVVWCTLPLVSTVAATLGAAIPMACLAMELEPSVIAAPAMTSMVDVSGLMAYFVIANQVFRIFGIEL